MHRGIRQNPKTELVKELKLTTNRGLAHDDEMSIEKLIDGFVDSRVDGTLCPPKQKVHFQMAENINKESSSSSLTRAIGLHFMVFGPRKVKLLMHVTLLQRIQNWITRLIVMTNGKRKNLVKAYQIVIRMMKMIV